MTGQSSDGKFLDHFMHSLEDHSFVKLRLGTYKGPDAQLKTLDIRKVIIKSAEKISITYHYKTRDIVKNIDIKDALTFVTDHLQNHFMSGHLLTTAFDLKWDGHTLKQFKPTQKTVSYDHDRVKKRYIHTEGKTYLQALKITDKNGEVFKNAQDKFRQINKYIEIIDSLIRNLPSRETHRIVDMGSGKGYLTFALYDYLLEQNIQSHITGVEFRQDLVDLCNGIGRSENFENLKFEKNTIEHFDATGTNILIALHACNTATDDAIAKGIKAGADLIIVAPCCHKQIRNEMERGQYDPHFQTLLRHGTFMERQAEMVTDHLRALILEYFGYTTKVFEFISDAHTPKNVMIVGSKNHKTPTKSADLLQKISESKSFYGISSHYLETLLTH